MTAEERATAIADKIVPAYRAKGSRYSCTGTIAKMWNAAYEGACSALPSQAAQPAEADGVEPRVRDDLSPIPEARVSLIARAVRASLRAYGHKVADSSLPECIASDVEATLRTMRPKAPATDAGEVERRLADAHAALRRIAEGNLGDAPWQANYTTIKQVACNALAGAPPAPTDAGEVIDPDETVAGFVDEYVMTTEGSDYEPTEWERKLIIDALHGWISEYWFAVNRLATPPAPKDDLRAAQDARRSALIERLSTTADLCCATPLAGDLGDVAYDLLRQAAAQIASDRQRIAALKENRRG